MPLDVRLTFSTYHKGPKPRQLRMCRSFLFINTANSYFAIQDEVIRILLMAGSTDARIFAKRK